MARQVVVYLGEASEDDKRAFSLLDKLAEARARTNADDNGQ
jgi:hypothetical protein